MSFWKSQIHTTFSLSPVAIHPFFNPSLCVCLCPLFFFSSLFNQCPTLFASVCLTCHHMGKGIKDLLWIKSQPCIVVWQSSKNLNIVSIIMLTTVCLVRGRVSEEPVIKCSYSYTGMHVNILYAWHYVSVNVFHLPTVLYQTPGTLRHSIRPEGCFCQTTWKT